MAIGTTNNGSKTVDSLLAMFDDGRLLLPEIQRDFVWRRPSIKLLIDSLSRGLPIGFVLVWKPRAAVATRPIQGRRGRAPSLGQERYGYLLDGQQRLTSLLLVRDDGDEFPLAMNLWPEEGDDRFYWRSKNERPTPWSVPVADALRGELDVTARLNEIKALEPLDAEAERQVHEALSALAAIGSHPVGVVEFETDNYRLATELFVRFNSTGRKLRPADLGMAQLAIDLPEFASTAIRPAAEKWPGMPFSAPFLVQCLLAVRTGRYQVREPEQVWAGEDVAAVKDTWREVERAVGKLATFLSGPVAWKAPREVPSLTALIPLVYLLAKGQRWDRNANLTARRWLLLACLRGYFSGSSQTTLDRVLRAVAGEPTPDRLWSFTRRDLPKLSGEDFTTGRLGGPLMSLYLSMLRHQNALDWGPGLSSLDGTVIGRGADLQVHHFFPRALLRKHKTIASDVDTFANYVVISQVTNLNAGTEEPATYLPRVLRDLGKEARKLRVEMRKQCIPSDPDLWRVANYGDFLAERRRLLAAAGNRFLGL